eukprot:94143-Pyramimonas_sp.AAC.1
MAIAYVCVQGARLRPCYSLELAPPGRRSGASRSVCRRILPRGIPHLTKLANPETTACGPQRIQNEVGGANPAVKRSQEAPTGGPSRASSPPLSICA